MKTLLYFSYGDQRSLLEVIQDYFVENPEDDKQDSDNPHADSTEAEDGKVTLDGITVVHKINDKLNICLFGTKTTVG